MFCNGNTKIFLWVKVVDNNWTVQHNILESAITVLNWNDSNDNIPLNTTSDVHYVNETYETFTPSANNYQPMSDILTNIVVGNGVIDHMNIKDLHLNTYKYHIKVSRFTDIYTNSLWYAVKAYIRKYI